MDAIDVLIARALTPQGQINTYAARAEQAVQQATQTLESINEIVENLSEINDLQDFTNTEIGKLTLSISNANNSDSIIQNLLIQYPNEE